MQSGDIIISRAASLLGKAIRWFQREGGEPPPFRNAVWNHVGIVFFLNEEILAALRLAGHKIPGDWLGKTCVVEALLKGISITPLEKFLGENEAAAVVHCSALSLAGRKRLVRHALALVGTPYSITRILAFAWEKITGRPVAIGHHSDELVCSTTTAIPYWVELGEKFEGKNWRRVRPDDIADHAAKDARWSGENLKGGLWANRSREKRLESTFGDAAWDQARGDPHLAD